MNDKAIKLLEFDAIRSKVAGMALSEESGMIILGEKPLSDKEEVKKLKSLVGAVMKRMTLAGGESRESLPALKEIISKLEVNGASLETDEAYAIGIFINRAETFRQWLLKPFKEAEGADILRDDPLTETARNLPSCGDVAKEVLKILDLEGNLRDLPEFKELRRRIRTLQKNIESTASRYAGSEDKRRMLQSEIPSQRDGRMVLAVKANFRGRIKGIVHEVSSTGQTVFIEPEEVVEMNNELLIENRRLEAEIRRGFRELTVRVASRKESLRDFYRGIVYLETIRARARYGFEHRWNFAAIPAGGLSPIDGGKLVLKQAKHPLLGSRAVPLDLFMENGVRTVIITGPNTGGKTVALKTLGLLALMNQFGLALPAGEGTLLPVFDCVYADIGDEQSISQSLSTFSAHMTNIAEIISSSTEQSLVLLDELGSGTDPEEGSAIAMAILDHFIEKKASLIITTHHGILKNYGYTREGVENASMEFDSRTLSPTYRIVMGIPGESRAVDIAAKNGFPPALVKQARSYLDEERSDVSALITGLKEKHRELEAAAEAGKREETRLLEERRKSDLKELRLKQKELQLRSEGVGSLGNLLGESRKTLENLVRELREGELELDKDKTRKVKEFLSNLEADFKAESGNLERENLALASERRRLEDGASRVEVEQGFSPGMEVLAGESRRRGRIVRLDKKGSGDDPSSWIVETGSLKMSFSEKDLVAVSAEAQGFAMRKSATWAVDLAPTSTVQAELRLRGMRFSDAMEALGKQLDAAVLGGLRQFAVIHGKGEGILQKGVHDFLKNDPRVADFFFSRPEAGGFGRTEVILR
jgi:DNA mismatch repair protein MutS2